MATTMPTARRLFAAAATLAALVTSSAAQAHPGHDHTPAHWLALDHFGGAVLLAVLGAAGIAAWKRRARPNPLPTRAPNAPQPAEPTP